MRNRLFAPLIVTVLVGLGLGHPAVPSAMAAYVDVINANSPIGYWQFEDVSSADGSVALDSTGNSTNDTYQGGVSLAADTPTLIGGQAASFNGSTSLINLSTDMRNLLDGASAVTTEAWIKNIGMPSGSSLYYILRNSVSASKTSVGFRLKDGNLGLGGRAMSDDVWQDASAPYNDSGTWHHVAGVHDYANDRIDIYVDGTLATSATASFTTSSYTKGTNTSIDDTIGAYDTGSGTSYAFKGLIDEVAAYDKDLGRAAVQTHYDVGANPGGSALAVGANAIANGDFDSWSGSPSEPTGWSVGGSNQFIYQTTGLNGSDTGAWLEGGQGTSGDRTNLTQSVLDISADWVCDLFFAMTDPDTGSTADERGFHMVLWTPSKAAIILRATEDNDLQIYDGSAYQTVFADAIDFSVDSNGDRDFDDTGDTLNEYHLRLIGHFNDVVPNYDIMLSSANEFSFQLADLGLTYYNSTDPVQGEGISSFDFQAWLNSSNGHAVVDQVRLVSVVPVPEPSSAVIPLAWLATLLAVRRRKR